MSFKRKTKRNPEFTEKQKALRLEVTDNIIRNAKAENKLLEEFLKEVLPVTDYNYFLFIKSKDGIPVNLKFNYESYIKALIAITDFEYEAYYFPVAFINWRDNAGTFDLYRCVYIDIDHTDINPLP